MSLIGWRHTRPLPHTQKALPGKKNLEAVPRPSSNLTDAYRSHFFLRRHCDSHSSASYLPIGQINTFSGTTEPAATMTMDVVKKVEEEEYSIKPQAVTPTIDTSSWPLLLKNYDQRT